MRLFLTTKPFNSHAYLLNRDEIPSIVRKYDSSQGLTRVDSSSLHWISKPTSLLCQTREEEDVMRFEPQKDRAQS